MEIRKLEVFCKVVELKSFTRTAEAVRLSQPTVSEHIRSLEEELDQKLIDRLGRHVEPTPIGQLLYGHAVKILRLHQEALQAVEQFSGNLVGRITIGCSTIPGTYILPVILSKFRKTNPDIKATLRINGSRIVARKVLDGEFDFGVVGAIWSDRGLEWSELATDQMVLAVHPAHPFAGKKRISIKDLLGQPFIFREQSSGTRRSFARLLEEQGFKENQLEEVAVIGSTAAVKEAVKAGIGVSVFSTRAIAEEIKFKSLVPIAIKEMTMERPFFLIQRKNRELSPVANVFCRYLRDTIK